MTWAKGQSGNPRGRPANPMVKKFHDAIEKIEQDNDINLFEEFVKQSLVEPALANAIMKKVLPDLKQVESNVSVSGNLSLDHLNDDELRDRIIELEQIGKRRTVQSQKGRTPMKKS